VAATLNELVPARQPEYWHNDETSCDAQGVSHTHKPKRTQTQVTPPTSAHGPHNSHTVTPLDLLMRGLTPKQHTYSRPRASLMPCAHMPPPSPLEGARSLPFWGGANRIQGPSFDTERSRARAGPQFQR
jgi:hypothetical protein